MCFVFDELLNVVQYRYKIFSGTSQINFDQRLKFVSQKPEENKENWKFLKYEYTELKTVQRIHYYLRIWNSWTATFKSKIKSLLPLISRLCPCRVMDLDL